MLASTNYTHRLTLLSHIDLSQRAGHPLDQLKTLHGSLFDIKCINEDCNWIQRGNTDDPFCPVLAEASQDVAPGEMLPLLDPYHRIRHIEADELPKCPSCKTGLQRPGVVWFGEALDPTMLMDIKAWYRSEPLVSSPCAIPMQGIVFANTRGPGSHAGHWNVCTSIPRCGLHRKG